MKYSEFKAEVEKMGFEVEENPHTVVAFRESDGSIIGKVYKQTTACLDTKWSSFVSLKDNEKNELLDLFARLAKTPLAEREEEKRYWLRYEVPPLLRAVHAKPRYLYRRIYDGYIDTSFSQTNDSTFKTIFTESEIAEMDITGFKKEPVE